MYEIKKLQISSVAKISGIASGIFGLIPMAFSFFSLLVPRLFLTGGSYYSYSSYEIMPLLFVLVIPLLAALIGYIYGAAMAFIYNLIVPYVGGVRMEIELIEENKQQ